MESLAPSDGQPLMGDLPLTGKNCADAHSDDDGDDFAVGHLTDDGPDNIASNPVNDAADSGASVADGDGDTVMTTKSVC